MSWTSEGQFKDWSEEPDANEHVGSTGRYLSLTEVSESLSGARTSCVEPHHPSLGEWCKCDSDCPEKGCPDHCTPHRKSWLHGSKSQLTERL